MVSARAASIGVIGGSWRAEYYLRAARELPDHFSVREVLVRTEQSAQRVGSRWGVSTTTSLEHFLAGAPYDYVVVSVPPEQVSELILRLIEAGIPVLTETPPAPSVEALFSLYRSVGKAPIQVAEQYQFQPHQAARLAIVAAGTIGDVTNVRVSVAHGYHGLSLMRLALGVGFEPVSIFATQLVEPVVSARGRDGWNDSPRKYDSGRTLATFRFGARSGLYDWNFEQYFSPIRSRHFDIYGTDGEINDDDVSYLSSPGHATHVSLHRESTGIDGDLEGFYLRGISLGDTVCYENRFTGARLNDDELAVAEVMFRMSNYANTGESFYGLADASQDQYLSLLTNQSIESGKTLQTADTPWATSVSIAARG